MTIAGGKVTKTGGGPTAPGGVIKTANGRAIGACNKGTKDKVIKRLCQSARCTFMIASTMKAAIKAMPEKVTMEKDAA